MSLADQLELELELAAGDVCVCVCVANLIGAWSSSWSGHRQKVVPGASYSGTALASSRGCSWSGLKLLVVFGASRMGLGLGLKLKQV